MSFSPSPGEVCQALPAYLEEIVGPSIGKRSLTGGIDGLLSELNRMNGESPEVSPDNDGKYRTRNVKWIQRATPSDVETQEISSCDGGDETGYLSEDFDIGLYVGIDWEISDRYLAEICDNSGTFFAKMLASKLNALVTKMDQAILASLWANGGVNIASGSNATRTYDLLDTNGLVKAGAWSEMYGEFQIDNLINNGIIAIGAGKANQASNIMGVGCCNDGVNMNQIPQNMGWNLYRDSNMNAGTGDPDNLLILQPGWSKLVFWTQYQAAANAAIGAIGGAAFSESSGRMRGVFIDPVSGVPFDMAIYPKCKDKYTVVLESFFDVWTTPTNAFSAGDTMSGYNGILKTIIT